MGVYRRYPRRRPRRVYLPSIAAGGTQTLTGAFISSGYEMFGGMLHTGAARIAGVTRWR